MIGRSLKFTSIAILAIVFQSGWTVAAGQQPRARTLHFDPAEREWVEENPPAPGTVEGDLYEAKSHLRRGEYRKAISGAAGFVTKYGDAHEGYPDSVLVRVAALVGMKKHDEADKVLQAFLSQFSSGPLLGEALRLQFVIAENFLAGAKRRKWSVFWISGKQRGLEMLDEIWTGYPDQRVAELAIKTKADYLFQIGDHALAELEYARLLRDYPQSRYRQFSLSRTAEAALASFGGVDYDEAALIESEERYRDYRTAYRGPAEREGVDLLLESIREMRAEKDLRIGEYYERTNHADSAIFYYRGVRRDFPNTLASAKAAERLSLLGAPVEPEGS
jgi:tetratricopeptide (TPR) repeat protein